MTPSPPDLPSLLAETAAAISARIGPQVSLRKLAVELYGDPGKAGLMADVRAGRGEHVSHPALSDLRRRLGLSYDVRHVIDVPHDADASVHVRPGGNGELRIHYVPPEAEVVVVPPGARVLRPSGQPKRERQRIDVTRYVHAGYSPQDLIEILDAALAERTR